MPRTDLRQKDSLNPYMTDRGLFESMVTGDVWVDAGLPQAFLYLIKNKRCHIPNEWEQTMANFVSEMEQWDSLLCIKQFFGFMFFSLALGCLFSRAPTFFGTASPNPDQGNPARRPGRLENRRLLQDMSETQSL